MKLYIMRHGPAEDDAPTGRDADRMLSTAGRERVRLVSQVLEAEGEAPLAILSSPLARALQTAEIVAEVTHLARRVRESDKAQVAGASGGVEIRRELGMGVDKLALLAELVRAGRKRVMIVGHEPDLSALVTALTGSRLEGGMQKAMVVGVKLTSDPQVAGLEFRSKRRFVLEPKTLTWHRD